MKVLTYHAKKLLLLLMVLAPALSAAGESTIVPNGARNGSIFSSLKEAGKTVGSGLGIVGRTAGNLAVLGAQGATQGVRFLTRPEMLKVEAVIASLGVAGGCAKAFWNRASLYKQQGELCLEEIPAQWKLALYLMGKFSKNDTAVTELMPVNHNLFNWGFDEFVTTASIRANPGRVVEKLKREWVTISRDPWNKQNVLRAVNQEITKIERYLEALDSYANFPNRSYDIIGIRKIYRDCLRQFNQGPVQTNNNFYYNTLNVVQENQLDQRMRTALKTKLIHWVCLRPNFGKAANLSWEIIKRFNRLQAIHTILEQDVHWNSPREVVIRHAV